MEGLIKQIILTGRFIAKGVALPPYIMKQMKKTRKSSSETNTKAALRYRSTTILKLLALKNYSGQKFIDQLSCKTGSHFGFFSVKFVIGHPCVRHNISFYIHGPVILHFLS